MISNLVNSKLSPEDIIFFLNKTNTSIQTLQCSVFNKGHLQTFSESWTDGSDFTQLPSSQMWARIQRKKKKKKIINKAVELCVIQAEVCISWWEDWNFTFRQTVWKCSKTSTAKRSTSMCYTPNDARTEPRVPQTLRGLLFLLWPFAQTRILFTLFNNHPLGQHAPANQNAFWPSSALQWGPPLLSPASHHNGIKKPALSDSWA